ncbi:MAG: guanylate kinase [Candidatus Riflebacteria bacterium]|nr:guanylate kinase [Candidatus Riflebacteria bacterium]
MAAISLPHLIIVVSGPSGAGKSTLCDRYTQTERNAELVITATTREPRTTEADGVDYHFLDRPEFERRIRDEEFLQWAEVHGNYYGSPLAEVHRLHSQGKDVILEIDVQGGLNVQRRFPSALLIYVTPSDLQELFRRLRGRATETAEQIQRRIANARKELLQLPHYDYVLFNDNLDTALGRWGEIIRSEKLRIGRYQRETLVDRFIKGAERLRDSIVVAPAPQSDSGDRRNAC